jgi:hypothetical protein
MTAPLDSGSLVLFLHIPKTAGTTLHHFFYTAYYPTTGSYESDENGQLHYGIYHYPGGFEHADVAPPPDLARILRRPDVHIVLGHFAFGIHELQSRPARYITVLRDPVERAVSVASHHLRWSEHGEREVPVAELEAFLVWGNLAELDNGQTRRISGVDPSIPDALSRAKQNLADHFAAVGLTERMAESVALFSNELNWDVDYWLGPRQVNPQKLARPLSEDVVAAVERRNAVDLELYRWCSSRFDEQIERDRPAFEARLARIEELRARAEGRTA